MDGPWPSVLLESSLAGDPWTFAGAAAEAVLRWDGPGSPARRQTPDGQTTGEFDDPLDALRWMERDAREHEARRWVGYVGYDVGRLFERLPERAADDLKLPWFVFSRHARARRSVPVVAPARPIGAGVPRSTFGAEAYQAAVARAIEYVRAGDVFQVNLSQRFTVPLPGRAAEVYARLQSRTPARYGAMLEYDGWSLVSNSPELFVRVTPESGGVRVIENRPIKGTRPLRAGMDVELLNSVKDQAELNMIIDLQRNDLGRVSRVGSVRVVEPRAIEAHPTVYHGVATVRGELVAGAGLVEILAATFPCGSVTGAPKIRAMEIIDELEPVRRGAYCGVIGWIDGGGAMQFSVAIRTMTAEGGRVHVPVGGGIVADSLPADEYAETLVKARAMFEALGLDGAGPRA